MQKKYDALAFFDLDGTLLNGASQVTPEVAEAMKTLRNNNVLPVIATGRTNVEIKEVEKLANITSAITMNGQYIEIEGENVYNETIPQTTCESVLATTRELGHDLGFYNSKMITVTNHNQRVENCYGYYHLPLPKVDGEMMYHNDVNMLLVISEEGDQLYKEKFPELTFYRNGPYSIDTVSKDASKGKSIKELLKILNLEGKPTYCFGDGSNDIPMFEVCENRIAMGNALPKLKEMSTFVTKKNTEGGIIHALKHFDLI